MNKDNRKIDSKVVCEAAINGDKLANDGITEIVNYLSVIIVSLILIINPQMIVRRRDICNLPEVDKLFIVSIKDNVESSIGFFNRKNIQYNMRGGTIYGHKENIF